MPPAAALDVFMRPAWSGENAYCGMLADALVEQGITVREMGFGVRAIPGDGGVALLHWPNEMFLRRGAARDARTLITLARIAWERRRRGLKLVWLVHNIVPHERDHPPFGIARAAFLRQLDGLVFLSHASRARFLEVYPRLAAVPSLITVHGHYLPRATRAIRPAAARTRGPARLALVGRVKRYKVPEALVAAAVAQQAGRVTLVIAGDCDEPALRQSLERLAAGHGQVALRFGALDAAAFEQAIDEADAVIAPYRDIVNSGSALHALSRARPFIAPRLGSLVEVQEAVGEEWVFLYDGDLTAATLGDAARWLRDASRPLTPDLSHFDWGPIGQDVCTFLSYLRGATAGQRAEFG